MPDRIGIGVVGTGFMGRCHALAWRSVGAVFEDVPLPELIAVCDVDAGAAARMAERFGFARASVDWRELVADPAIAVVSITLPNALHKEVAVAALRAGKHVWCEKPMALTLADAKAMASTAAEAPGVTALGYNYLRNPAVEHAARLIGSGAIGKVAQFRGVVDEDYSADPALPWSWRYRRAAAGLGVLADLMCHLISVAQRLAGPIERVCGDLDTVHLTRPLSDQPGERCPVENEDVASALVRFAGGASGTLASSRIAWGRKNHLAWEVHGTRGTLAFDQERMNELLLFEADGPAATRGFRTILTGPLHPPYARFCPAPGHGLGFNDLKVIEAAQLLLAIAGRAAPPTSFAEGLAIERTVHAIATSVVLGSWVRTEAVLPRAEAPTTSWRGLTT